MTSIPASRSARAMIFAPRSCPSKPGLATTTRILPLEAASTAGRGPTGHAAASDSRGPPSWGPRLAADRGRLPPFPPPGLHVGGRLRARPGSVPRPTGRLREPPAALLPAHLAAARRRRRVAATGVAARGRRRRSGDLLDDPIDIYDA